MSYWRDKESRDVRDFAEKFDMLRADTPGHLSPRKAKERVRFLLEELRELAHAFDVNDLAAQADALVDLVYVAKGTAIMLGLPWEELWDEVQRANMAKVRGVGPRGNPVDCVKPEGWVPPNHFKILNAAGYSAGEWFHPSGDLAQDRDDQCFECEDHAKELAVQGLGPDGEPLNNEEL